MTRIRRALFTVSFWADAAERAVKSAAQGALVALGGDKALDILDATWGNVAVLAAGMAVLSVLTSVASAGSGGVSPASLARTGGEG